MFINKKKTLEDIKIICTKDKNIIKEFCKMLSICYNQSLDIPYYNPNYNDLINDKTAFPIVAIKDNSVIAGSVLYIKDSNSTDLLSLEKDLNINLNKKLSFVYKIKKYGEISKVVVLPKYKSKNILLSLYSYIIQLSLKHNCFHLYSINYIQMFRCSRVLFHHLGVEYRLIKEFKVPKIKAYGKLNMLLGVVDLTTAKIENFLTGPDIDNAVCLTKHIKKNVINNLDDDNKKEIKAQSCNIFLILIITLFLFMGFSDKSFAYTYDIELAEDIIDEITVDNKKEYSILEDKLAFDFVLGFIGYVNNITLFIEKKEVVIAVVGNFTDKEKDIYKKFSDKNINASNLSVKLLLTPNIDDVSSANILYITKYYHGNIDSMLNNIDTYNKLIIVDRKHFKTKKAMIKFYTYRDKLKFLINNKLALENGIMLNAKLLELGTPNL